MWHVAKVSSCAQVVHIAVTWHESQPFGYQDALFDLIIKWKLQNKNLAWLKAYLPLIVKLLITRLHFSLLLFGWWLISVFPVLPVRIESIHSKDRITND